MIRRRRGLFVIAACLWLGATPAAHPGAASDVVLDLGRSSVDVILTTDARSLRLKLEALAGRLSAVGISGDRAAIVELRAAIVEHVALDAGNLPVALQWVGLEEPADTPDGTTGRVAVRLRAVLPDGACSVRFRTRLILGSYPLIVRRAERDDLAEWLQGPTWSSAVSMGPGATGGWSSTAVTGLWLGVTHIVPKGLDHILFVLGLFLGMPRLRPLVAQMTAFTLAHTLTLALATVGLFSLPARIVEPLIALSIVFVGIEVVWRTRVTRWRLPVVFTFGLLHGLGFAGALASHGLPAASMLTTLVTFNAGVELGQAAVLVAACAVVRLLALDSFGLRRFVVRPASLAIVVVGAVWTIERLWG